MNNMIILCVICRDPLIPSDEVFFTNCGHVFHFQCIDQWLKRSPTCPHCRETINTITEKKIRRVYFTYSSDETPSNINIAENLSLQEKVANLKFQILLKDKNIQNFTAKNAVLKMQNAELRLEVRNVESEMNKQNSIIYDLKEKIKHLNECSSQYKVLEEQFSKTKKKLDKFERMMIKKKNKITTLKSQFKCRSKFWEREQRKNLLHFKQYITSYKNKNLFLKSRISELEQLLENSEQNCITKSSSQRNSNNHSLVIPQPKGNIYNQTDTRQKTKNQNDTPSPPWISTDMNEEECTLDITLDEYPSSTKKARLCLQSGNDSDEINNTRDVGNISSMNKQSKKKKILKVKSFQ